jgi:hypothetical protein
MTTANIRVIDVDEARGLEGAGVGDVVIGTFLNGQKARVREVAGNGAYILVSRDPKLQNTPCRIAVSGEYDHKDKRFSLTVKTSSGKTYYQDDMRHLEEAGI